MHLRQQLIAPAPHPMSILYIPLPDILLLFCFWAAATQGAKTHRVKTQTVKTHRAKTQRAKIYSAYKSSKELAPVK